MTKNRFLGNNNRFCQNSIKKSIFWNNNRFLSKFDFKKSISKIVDYDRQFWRNRRSIQFRRRSFNLFVMSFITISSIALFFDGELKQLRRGENALRSERLEKFRFCGTTGHIAAVVKASMKKKTYDVQVHPIAFFYGPC